MADEQSKRVAEGGSVEHAERKQEPERDLIADAAETAAFGRPSPDNLTDEQRAAAGVFKAPPKAAEADKSRHIPEPVASRFLRDGDKFHFTGGDKKLAFTDQGEKLVAKTNDAIVGRSLVDIAEARGWDAVHVRGAETFRREVWKEAAARGIEVQGYKPTRLEVVEMELRRSQQNEVTRAARTQAPAQAEVQAVKPADHLVTLYQPADATKHPQGAAWWTSDPFKVNHYGQTCSATVTAEAIGKHAATYNSRAGEYLFPSKSPVELAKERLVAKAGNVQQPAETATPDVPQQPTVAAAPKTPTLPQPTPPRGAPYVVTGTLVGIGHQPYGTTPRRGWNLTNNSEPGKATYYALVQTEKGERVLWGDDIGRAFGESLPRVQIGDKVKAGNLGRHDVIPAPGQPPRNRQVWVIERPESYDKRTAETHAEFVTKKPIAAEAALQVAKQGADAQHRTQLAEAFRKDAGVNTERMIAMHPELLGAAASMRMVIAKAEQSAGYALDIDKFKGMLREAYAGKIARGEPIQTPQIKVEAQERAQEQERGMVRA